MRKSLPAAFLYNLSFETDRMNYLEMNSKILLLFVATLADGLRQGRNLDDRRRSNSLRGASPGPLIWPLLCFPSPHIFTPSYLSTFPQIFSHLVSLVTLRRIVVAKLRRRRVKRWKRFATQRRHHWGFKDVLFLICFSKLHNVKLQITKWIQKCNFQKVCSSTTTVPLRF